MSVRVKAWYTDGTTAEATAGARAQVDFERKYEVSWAGAFGGRGGPGLVEHAYYFTWVSLKLAGEDVGEDFEAWLDRVDDAGLLPDNDEGTAEDKPNPTKRGRSRAASSS